MQYILSIRIWIKIFFKLGCKSTNSDSRRQKILCYYIEKKIALNFSKNLCHYLTLSDLDCKKSDQINLENTKQVLAPEKKRYRLELDLQSCFQYILRLFRYTSFIIPYNRIRIRNTAVFIIKNISCVYVIYTLFGILNFNVKMLLVGRLKIDP